MEARPKNLAAICCALFVTCCLAASLKASENITCKSPDGKFALRCTSADVQPYSGDTALIDLATHKTVLPLDSNWTIGQVKLVWSRDSRRIAYFTEKENGYVTRIFVRSDGSFHEVALPDLPSPKRPQNATGSDAETSVRVEPIKWTTPSDLLVEKELINPAWGRAALKFTLAFDQDNRPSILDVAQEKVSVVDYFLLLPRENFEAPLSSWLRMMRGGDFFPCDTEPENNVDERNGYMYCRGDGAQPEFEVALFRYRNGRPLLALCSGELEGPEAVQLNFFEPGAGGKMHEIRRSIFPVADSKDDRWQFELPKQGKIILVRARKSKKILHKFTWNGEKFQEQ